MSKDVVQYIVKELVAKPDKVFITEKREDSKIILEIHVDEGDLGKVIGKSGNTIRAIRSIASLMSPDRNLFVDVAK